MLQMKEQDKKLQLNEEDIENLSENEFRVVIIDLIQDLERGVDQ